jgi:hypothetical protein
MDRGIDPATTFDRLERLLSVNASQPSVRVNDEPSFPEFQSSDRVFEIFGLTDGSVADSPLSVSGSSAGRHVSLGFDDAPASEVEGVLVHEFTHSIQAQTGLLSRAPPDTFDSSEAWRAVVEGGAVYASTQYADQYGDGRNWTAFFGQMYDTGPGANRYAAAASYFGARYYHAVLDTPSRFDTVGSNPPSTTETVLHPHEPVEDPRALSVLPQSSANWTVASVDRRGELFTRVVLRGELDESRAAEAAAGWGNDRLVEYRRGDGDDALVWVHRWDTATDATEFATAFDKYRDGRTETTSSQYRLVRVNTTTTAVYAGAPEFVRNATATVNSNGTIETAP